MSKMYDYTDVVSLIDATKDWKPLTDYSKQHYALKFVFGEIDAAKRLLASLKSKGEDIDNVANRIGMLKQLARSIVELNIVPPVDNRFVEKGCQSFIPQNSNTNEIGVIE